MFSLSPTICEIFTKLIKLQKFDLEDEGHGQGGEKLDLRQSTRNDRFHIDDFFIILAIGKKRLCKR